jgi:hypothetical protein
MARFSHRGINICVPGTRSALSPGIDAPTIFITKLAGMGRVASRERGNITKVTFALSIPAATGTVETVEAINPAGTCTTMLAAHEI